MHNIKKIWQRQYYTKQKQEVSQIMGGYKAITHLALQITTTPKECTLVH